MITSKIIINFIGQIFNKKNLPFILSLLFFILIFLNLNTCNRLKKEKESRMIEKKIYNQNFEAFLDSITVTYNKKLDAFQYDKNSFLIRSLDELEKYNKTLADKLSKLEKGIISAIDSKVVVDVGKVEIDNELETFDDENYGLKWKYDYNDDGFSQYLSGVSKFKLINNKIYPNITVIDTNYLTLNVTYGFTEVDDKYKVWAVSMSPKVKINELNGAYFIDKHNIVNNNFKKDKWVIGPNIGYGVNFNNSFQDSRLGWHFGLSLQYNIYGFGKK